MIRLIAAIILTVTLSADFAPAGANAADVQQQLLALERQAMDGFLKGDPDPMLVTLDPQVSYFHVMTTERLDGIAAVRSMCEQYRGRPLFDRYEIVNPQVQGTGDIAVLSYILVRHVGDDTSRWNATQIYRRKDLAWKVIHTHWSATAEPKKSGNPQP